VFFPVAMFCQGFTLFSVTSLDGDYTSSTRRLPFSAGRPTSPGPGGFGRASPGWPFPGPGLSWTSVLSSAIARPKGRFFAVRCPYYEAIPYLVSFPPRHLRCPWDIDCLGVVSPPFLRMNAPWERSDACTPEYWPESRVGLWCPPNPCQGPRFLPLLTPWLTGLPNSCAFFGF